MSVDSSNSSYRYVPVDGFNPNSATGWTLFGNVTQCLYDKGDQNFTLTGTAPPGGMAAPVLKISILGPTAFRVRFNPKGDYSMDGSFAVVNKKLGAAQVTVLQNDASKLSVDLGNIRLDVLFQPFTVQVYWKNQLISTDTAQGLIYLASGGEAVANFKNYPANANYFGAGEKGGQDLKLNEAALTFFNYDNFKYSGSNENGGGFDRVIPFTSDPNPALQPGPLNWREPLYNSIPFFIEENPDPLDTSGHPTGVPYAYGILLDNESQTYMNFGASSDFNGNMYGKYFFGALYGEIDYYFMAGDTTQDVLKQYTTLVGPAALAPMWALGNHQGCYGYYDQGKVINAIQQYRAQNIPLDGMHIDVDFQNNYRTFTASNKKFPNGGATCFSQAAALGVKCSTNITGIVTIQPLDEDGNASPYPVLQSGSAINAFIQDNRAEGPGPAYPKPFVTNESYGLNFGFNPYPSPGAPYTPVAGAVALGTYGYYADLGQQAFRDWWGQQYKPLLDAGLEMVWQDMTDPATQPSVCDSAPYKTLPLNVLMFDYTQNKLVPSAHIHNVFALNLISATHTGFLKLRQAAGVDKRPFIIARGGFAGVHRYAASWTGDSASDWNFLAILIPEILNFGLSGQPMAGADVGGFATSSAGGDANGTGANGVTDPELMARWTTLSAFIGWCRNHYDGYSKQYQEPYAYPDPCRSACRKYIEIRYKLLQLFYDLLYQCTQTGLPICRPMFLTDRQDPNVYQPTVLNTQFMVGNDLLIAPITQHGSVNRDVYLPAGSDWFPYQDAQSPLPAKNSGGQTFNWYAPLDLVPIYVRAGAIVPRRELEQYVGQLPQCPLTFECYPGPDRTYTLYLDDKAGLGYQQGNYRLTTISQQTAAGGARTVTIARTHDQYNPKEPSFYIALLQASHATGVTTNGAAVPDLTAASDAQSTAALAASPGNAFYFNVALQTVFIKVMDNASTLQTVTTF